MACPEKLVDSVQNTIYSSIDRILNFETNTTVIDQQIKLKILNNINKSFEKEMGKTEFDKFCRYLMNRGINLFIDDKDNTLTVCFHNGFMFFKIKDIINDYYKDKENNDGRFS